MSKDEIKTGLRKYAVKTEERTCLICKICVSFNILKSCIKKERYLNARHVVMNAYFIADLSCI